MGSKKVWLGKLAFAFALTELLDVFPITWFPNLQARKSTKFSRKSGP